MYREKNLQFAEQFRCGAGVFDKVVVLELPPGQERRSEAIAAFALGANLLARLFTSVRLVSPDVPVCPHPWQLKNLHDLKAPLAGLAAGEVLWGVPRKPDIVLGIGSPPTIGAARATFVSFAGWRAGLDQVIDDPETGIFGALFAACYGTAQAFLHAVAAEGGRLQPMKPFQMSLLDYTHGVTNAGTPHQVDLGEVHLVGVGAAGCALIYALAHLTSLQGILHLIDNDLVDGTNLQRYILMRLEDLWKRKTDVAAAALGPTGLQGISHPMSAKQFATEHGYNFDVLITPVDSEAGRRQLSKYLPRRVLNAATGGSTVTISRHGFGDGKACLHCLYLQAAETITTERRLAMDLGLSIGEVESFLSDNRGIDEETVRRVERHRQLPVGRLQEWVGQHLQSFYHRAVCSEASVPMANGTLTAPLSFISATAGVLLGAEFVKGATPALRPFVLDNYFRVDTLHAPNPSFHERRAQEPTRRCICWEEDFVEAYREKYPS